MCQPEFDAVSPALKSQLNSISDEYYYHTSLIGEILKVLTQLANKIPLCQILLSIPGIGFINATAIYSDIGNGSQFENGRPFGWD
ncbi:MAG: transposase [Lentisphaeria bacterium]